MKIHRITLLFFSPTGHCRQIAHALAESVDLPVKQVDLTASDARSLPLSFIPGELVLFIVPVHAQDIPRLVKNYIKGLSGSGTPAVLLTVSGGVSTGSALWHGAKLLKHAGFIVAAAASLNAGHSYLPAGPDNCFSERQLHGLISFYHHSIAHLNRTKEIRQTRIPFRMKNPLAYLPQSLLCRVGTRPPMQKARRCNQCGACDRVCPANAITGRPHSCIRCFACVQACPTGARQLRLRTALALYLRHARRHQEDRFYF